MRVLLVFLLVSFIPIFLVAQTTGEQLPAHNSENAEILHTDDNRFIGRMKYPPTLLESQDQGQSWNEIGTTATLNRIPLINVDRDGNYLFLLDDGMYKWIPGAIGLQKFIDLDSGERWNAIGPLANGNIIVGEISSLHLYDENGMLLRSDNSFGRIQNLMTTDGDEHYVFQGNHFGNIIKINSDMEILERGPAGELYTSDKFIYADGRFYGSREYSDDGFTWQDYGNGVNGIVTILDNGDIHLVGDCAYSNTSNLCDEVYISRGRGETFQFAGNLDFEFLLPSSGSVNFRSDTHVGSVAIGQRDVMLYDNGRNYFSQDGISDWRLLGQEVGAAFAFSVEASSKENLIVRADKDNYKVTDSDTANTDH